jgi:preprotein translocase subunit SecD
MKALNWIVIVIFIFLYSCNQGVKTERSEAEFGIYEIVKSKELPAYIIDTLKATNIITNEDLQQPITGYLSKNDSIKFSTDFSNAGIKIAKTVFLVDKERNYYAIVALKINPAISNSDIQKTKARNRNVEIYFNINGAKKWAEMTKKNIGNQVAFVIDNQIYNMSEISSVINEGVAQITNLKDEAFATGVSESLNASLPE